jgi:hypothetical protein
MMEKLNFEPEIEIVRFGAADIVTTSGLLDDDELPPWVIYGEEED